MGRESPIATDIERVLACNLCGGVEHLPVSSRLACDLVRCAGCGLVFVGNLPCPGEGREGCGAGAGSPGERPDPGDPAYRKMRKLARRHLKMLRRSVGDAWGLRLLEIGCANGLFLVEALQAGFEVHGTEPSPDNAAFARSQFGLEVHAGDWRDAGHADGSFDVVTLFGAIAYLPDPLGELAAIRRLLRPGGLLLQSTANIDGLFARLSSALARQHDHRPQPEPPHHLYRFSDRTLAELTERAGYEVTRVDQARIRLGHAFGTPASRKVSPQMRAYAALFAPVALAGPWLGMGDWLYLGARRPE
jgi:SAM-dependent methyltransferase